MANEKEIAEIEKNGTASQGQRQLLAHLKGERLSARQAALAYCYQCGGYYQDGRDDCEIPTCPLHPFMPYNPNKLKSTKAPMSPENRAKAGDRLRASRIRP